MRALHDLARVTARFDDASLVPSAGLLAPAVPAQRLDLSGLIDWHVDLGDRPGGPGGRPPPACCRRAGDRRSEGRSDDAPAPGPLCRNAAWTAFAAMAHNLTRTVGIHAGDGFTHATGPTIRRKLINVSGRLVRSARRLHLRLPRDWPWEHAMTVALTSAAALPQRC